MAGSERNSGGASQIPKSEATIITIISPKKRKPRRQQTLITITICLNALLWSSIANLLAAVFLFTADPNDNTNIASQILTIASALVSVAYISLHSVVARRQKTWSDARLQTSALKKTCYIAIRLAITLCILWLLASGWGLIIAAHHPICLPSNAELAGWEKGATCIASRISVAMSLIALISSFTLFGILAIVRRPFEAHLFRHKYNRSARRVLTPKPSNLPSCTVSTASVKCPSRSFVHTTSLSNPSNADVDTIDLDATPSSIHSVSLGIFTSPTTPPPLSPLFLPARTASLTDSIAPSMAHSTAPAHLIPLPLPPLFSDSAWRAIHPPPSNGIASRSFPFLPLPNGEPPRFEYLQHRPLQSNSKMSLTMPQRLSATPTPTAVRRPRSAGYEGSTDTDGGVSRAKNNSGEDARDIDTGSGATQPHLSDINTTTAATLPIPPLAPVLTPRKLKIWRPRLEGQVERFEGLGEQKPKPITFLEARDDTEDEEKLSKEVE
ncbi:hypothetical protein K432DRAFT_135587 [Lepidopterella palustris CBS 459.81]|uniref:Uncharacterized protein n=1 Tax=Lepidopterella palustris CBS 459.81 TaxID=1314670 RepID=A0A8E2E431_9PEZI|nr:hypothetical protein K432DRAFT_135587 [Lepidopterella palustris CBS 459.81]